MIIENIRWRLFICFAAFLAGLLVFMPNLIKLPEGGFLPSRKLVYGLDIQGGLHLVMGVDIDSVLKESTERTMTSLKSGLEAENIKIKSIQVIDPLTGRMNIELADPSQAQTVQDYLRKQYDTVLQVLSANSGAVEVAFFSTYLNDHKAKVIEQAIETIRNRIDEFGVAEPSISSLGTNRILVQLPGIQDAAHAKDLINRTARLEFMMVDTNTDPMQIETLVAEAEKAGNYKLGENLPYTKYVERVNADLKAKLPEKTLVLFEKLENAKSMEAGKRAVLVRTDQTVAGDLLKDAFVSQDQYGRPVVSFQMSPIGAKQLGELTEANIKKPMAIVLDRVVKSAPIIQSRISDSGQITLGSSRDRNQMFSEAKLISMALRAGALPATLTQLEERTVSATVGRDAVAKGRTASIIGAIFVFLFMLVLYRGLGLIADIALGLNILLIMAILTTMGATLTLPGIAGIALTVGMAVDTNIVIYERIKEEFRRGMGMETAIKEGFHRASTAILDSQITTAATCVVLMYYGTGPVRGFAVTLLVGIATSLFTAVFVSRTLIDWAALRLKIKLV